MDRQNLIGMANRIGDFFAAMPEREEALLGIANHLRNFWEPRMRRQLLDYVDGGQCGELRPIVLDAIAAHHRKLRVQQ
ncbi:MAG: formate dehydrogenase subunit delta [Sideroxydans sp.]